MRNPIKSGTDRDPSVGGYRHQIAGVFDCNYTLIGFHQLLLLALAWSRPINASLKEFGYYRFNSTAPAGAQKTMRLNELPFASQHSGGAHFDYADGSVHFFDPFDQLYNIPSDVDQGWLRGRR